MSLTPRGLHPGAHAAHGQGAAAPGGGGHYIPGPNVGGNSGGGSSGTVGVTGVSPPMPSLSLGQQALSQASHCRRQCKKLSSSKYTVASVT